MSTTWIIFRTVLLTPWLGYLCFSDAKYRRLPNVWTLGGLAAGLLVQSGWWGWAGLKDGLAAAGVGVLFMLVPFLIRGVGAGDLKMLAACGAFLGLREMPLFLIATSFAGFFVLVWMIVARHANTARLKHLFRSVFDWRYDRKAGKAALPPKSDERVRVPFGVAIAIGVWATLAAELVIAWK